MVSDANEAANTPATVAVFGGTGFLGRRVVRRFAEAGHQVRAVSRHPERSDTLAQPSNVRPVRGDVHDRDSVREAVREANVVVNAVSLYLEGGGTTFHSVHVAGAERVAEEAARAGAEALVHVSGLGASREASNDYVRARGEGEDTVRRAFPDAAIIRPSVMFAADGGLLATLVEVAGRMPVIPLFGRGETRLQPVHADDVAEAALCAAHRTELHGRIHSAGGPAIYTYRQLLELVLRESGKRRPLMPFPFALWELTAAVGERLPGAPVTRSQVALMREDNTAADSPIFDACGIRRRTVEATLKEMAESRR